jgi:YesN/AraC family two-component response regulator
MEFQHLHPYYEVMLLLAPNASHLIEGTPYNSIEQKMYEVSSFIHANYKDDISLTSLSEQFFISPSYLSREFKQVTGLVMARLVQSFFARKYM